MRGLTALPRRNKKHSRLSGVAAVEFAVCLPVLVLVVLSTIEVNNAIFLRQGLHIAAYEGAKELATPDGTLASANTEIQNILSSRSISSATVTMTPNDPALLVRGATITVEVAAQLTGNSPIRTFIGNRTITVRVVMCHK
jgi:Flp pilus assembly protein TadG